MHARPVWHPSAARRTGSSADTAQTPRKCPISNERRKVTRFPRAWLSRYTPIQTATGSLITDYGRSGKGCYAWDATLAAQLGVDRSAISRATAALTAGGDVRVTDTSGQRRTRWARPVAEEEDAVAIPAAARDDLAILGAPFTVYAELSFQRDVQNDPQGCRVSGTDLAEACGIGERMSRRAVAELEARGWITHAEPGGGRGKAPRYLIHDAPVRGRATPLDLVTERPRPYAQTPPENATVQAPEMDAIPGQLTLPDPVGTAGNPVLSAHETRYSAHIKPGTERTQNKLFLTSSVEQAEVVGGCSSPEGERSVPRARAREADDHAAAAPAPRGGPGDGAPRAEPNTTTLAGSSTTRACLPPLTVTPRVHHVLAELGPLVGRMTRWQQRETARAIGRTLDTEGGDIERLALRVRFRVATADLATVRDSYAWATRRALPRRGCHNPDCEDGHLWSTGQECRACAEALTRRRTSRTEGTRPTPAPAAPGSVPVATWRCGTCGTPGTGDPPASSQCHTCWANTPEGATDFLAASLARPAEPAPGAPDNPPDLPGTTTYRAMRAALRARSPA